MLNDANGAGSLGWLQVSGSAYEVGHSLGLQGRLAVHSDLIRSPLWSKVTSPENREVVQKLSQFTEQNFPEIFEEIAGLADGLKLPFEDVFAWNCRGDLLAHTSDGCTTVQLPGEQIVIAHNEDGLPFFNQQSFIVEASGERGFISFCYPGSIPGHTFALTNHDMVVTVNNLRLTHFEAEVPRMVLTRALLDCSTVDLARQLLTDAPVSGGFHLSLAQRGDPRLMSIEFGGGFFREMEIKTASVHANHAVLNGCTRQNQIATQSSLDRQKRGSALVSTPNTSPMAILRDKDVGGLPIWRQDADDPDNENTIATAVFTISSTALNWTFYAGDSKTPLYERD